jgi:hypothetical protein
MNRLCFFLILSTPWMAAGAPEQPPEPPWVQSIPAMAKWEMTFSPLDSEIASSAPAIPEANEAIAPPDEIRSVICTRTGKTQKTSIIMSSGKSHDFWIHNGEVYIKHDNLISSGTVSRFTPAYYSISDHYFGTEWIKDLYFECSLVEAKRGLHYYLTQKKAPQTGELPKDQADQVAYKAEAWIDTQTRLPAKVMVEGQTIRYKFHPAPTTDLKLPEEFSARAKLLEKESKQRAQEAAAR